MFIKLHKVINILWLKLHTFIYMSRYECRANLQVPIKRRKPRNEAPQILDKEKHIHVNINSKNWEAGYSKLTLCTTIHSVYQSATTEILRSAKVRDECTYDMINLFFR